MNIAILTLPLHTNYGGILQAYALQTVLERMGHKVEVLDKKRREKPQLPINVKIKRFILKYILLQKINPLREDIFYKRHKTENKYTWKFADKYIHRREIYSFNEIKEGEYDAIVVGSDQVWRPHYFRNNYKNIADAFLSFAKNWQIKRIAYAPSFGTETWEYSLDETIECAILLKEFNLISVREESGVSLCKNKFNINAKLVCDPTLLLKKEDYIKLFKNKTNKLNRGILCYFLDNNKEKQEFLRKIEQKLKLSSFKVNSSVEDINNNEIVTQPPVEEWLKGFYDANFILTDSFHACIFSIIFKKPFIVYGNKDRGLTRIKSLLKLYNIEDRLITNENQKINISKYPTSIYKKINLVKNYSFNLLDRSLNT